MSMFMSSMANELREKGRIDGLGGLSSAAWEAEVREYEARLERDRQERLSTPTEEARP